MAYGISSKIGIGYALSTRPGNDCAAGARWPCSWR